MFQTTLKDYNLDFKGNHIQNSYTFLIRPISDGEVKKEICSVAFLEHTYNILVKTESRN